MSGHRIPFQAPQLPSARRTLAYFRHSDADRWYSNRGPCHRLLEQRLADYVGSDVTAFPVANCTLGLMVALRAGCLMMDRIGQLVIMPSYTFVASASAALWAGYVPLLIDVDPTSWQPDTLALEQALESRGDEVAAVMGCSTFGTPASRNESDAWERMCARYEVPLIIDSAAGFGALADNGHRVGARGDAEVFSFHATKPFAVGEGGVVTSRNSNLLELVGRLVNFGFDQEHRIADIGLNAKMSELHAATALAVLDDYDRILTLRRELAARFHARMAGHGFTWQMGFQGSTFQFVPVLASDSTKRDRILEAATSADIEVRSYFSTPLHRYDGLNRWERHGDLSVTEDLALRTLSLPMANDLTDDDVERIADLCIHHMPTQPN